MVTEVLWPNKQVLGCRSIDFGVEASAQTEIVQSVPAVMRVLESGNKAEESWPWCMCSKRPISYFELVLSELTSDAVITFLDSEE